MEYKHILVATDFSASGYAVAARARQLQVALGAAITILNVVEYSFINLGGDLALPPQIDIESQLVENATKKLADLVAAEAYLRCQPIIKVGVPKTEILPAWPNPFVHPARPRAALELQLRKSPYQSCVRVLPIQT